MFKILKIPENNWSTDLYFHLNCLYLCIHAVTKQASVPSSFLSLSTQTIGDRVYVMTSNGQLWRPPNEWYWHLLKLVSTENNSKAIRCKLTNLARLQAFRLNFQMILPCYRCQYFLRLLPIARNLRLPLIKSWSRGQSCSGLATHCSCLVTIRVEQLTNSSSSSSSCCSSTRTVYCHFILILVF